MKLSLFADDMMCFLRDRNEYTVLLCVVYLV